jgi:hypothetical protein
LRSILLLVLSFLCLVANAAAPAGQSEFLFDGWEGPAIKVRLFLPDGYTGNSPVVFVLHGASRDATRYFEDWSAAGQAHGLIVVVPEFNAKDFPRSAAYNLGNVFEARSGTVNRRSTWSFSVLEPLFDHVLNLTGGEQDAYTLYGHSAGSQFVHRFLYYMPDARVKRAIAANAGWYTMPEFGIEYPYGLEGSTVGASQLRGTLGRELVILLGDADIDTEAEKLRKTPEAELQGENRLVRGHTMYRVGKAKALELGVPFNWRLQEVPGAGHVNQQMTEAAAALVN